MGQSESAPPPSTDIERDRKEFARRLTYWFEKSGISTQNELARAAGLQAPQISKYMTGREMPGQTNLRALCRGLGIDLRMFWSPIDDVTG